jgi:hypothetical protein
VVLQKEFSSRFVKTNYSLPSASSSSRQKWSLEVEEDFTEGNSMLQPPTGAGKPDWANFRLLGDFNFEHFL